MILKIKSAPRSFLLATFASLISTAASAALIPAEFINSVVALGEAPPGDPGQPVTDRWITRGTGFFYGYLVKNDPSPERREYELYLVTAKHVVTGYRSSSPSDLKIRINPNKPGSRGEVFSISYQPKPGESTWFFHPNTQIDIAAVRINHQLLKERDSQFAFFTNDQTSADRTKMRDLEVSAGDGVFVLGFPMNMAGAQKNYVIARQGSIARVNEMLDQASTTFMLDAFVFPGNSGGPAILKPELTSLSGTKNHPQALLIGLITSFHPYHDLAISQQTGRQRIIFEENSGLAEVLPVDFIDEAIQAWRSKHSSVN